MFAFLESGGPPGVWPVHNIIRFATDLPKVFGKLS